MKPNTIYSSVVRKIVIEAQKYNDQIGNYEFDIIDENFDIVVKLDNGRLKISTEIAQDYPNVRPTDMKSIANTFIAI